MPHTKKVYAVQFYTLYKYNNIYHMSEVSSRQSLMRDVVEQ